MAEKPIRVTVWNEFIHERTVDSTREIYPNGIHEVLAAALRLLRVHCLQNSDHAHPIVAPGCSQVGTECL